MLPCERSGVRDSNPCYLAWKARASRDTPHCADSTLVLIRRLVGHLDWDRTSLGGIAIRRLTTRPRDGMEQADGFEPTRVSLAMRLRAKLTPALLGGREGVEPSSGNSQFPRLPLA